MNEKRQVRGLLDMLDAEREGQLWEWEALAPGVVPGMGLGASSQATRWAWLGMQMEAEAAIQNTLKRPAHRPAKDPLLSKDAVRAFAVWRMCHGLRHDILNKPNAHISTRELVALIRQVENALNVPKTHQLFSKPDQTVESSITRGKQILEIDDAWNSQFCDKLEASLTQTT